MTTSPENTCVAGDSTLTASLRRFLRDLDWRDPRVYEYDRITTLEQWPAGVLEFFLKLGVLRELEPDAAVWLEDCEDPDWFCPEWQMNLTEGRVIGLCHCGYESCNFFHEVELERRQQWGPSLEGTIAAVMRALGLDDHPIEDVSGRVWRLGSASREGRTRDVYLVKGSIWPDAPAIFAQAQRLAACANATVLCFAKMPPLDRRPASWRTVLSLQETGLIKDGSMVLPIERLFEDQAVLSPRPAVREEPTLTESEIDVLLAMAERADEAHLVAQLAAASGYGRDTVMKAIKLLVKHRLVARPEESLRKGVIITKAGLDFVGRLPKMA